MTQIADPDKFYKVSNYAALNDILSSLQQNLTGIEGKNVFIKHYVKGRFVDSSHAKI